MYETVTEEVALPVTTKLQYVNCYKLSLATVAQHYCLCHDADVSQII
jgi:hypothetical protein